ncbi:MAG: thiol protease/hemagglutinin PrtT [Bacteroidales bacterium]|nr:thiol protease/hemagglutinin PrtT [Bacteroidales bacterium]
MKRYKIQMGLVLSALFQVAAVQAQQVSSTVARNVALNFMNSMYTDKTRTIQAIYREGANPMQAVASDAATINIVTFNQGGWIILSNDESAPPVLAFCETGTFSADTNDMPGGLIELMQDYRDIVGEIRRDYSAKGTTSDYSDNQSAWGKLKNSQAKGKPTTIYVDNLLNDPARDGAIKWGQHSAGCNGIERAYNKFMPEPTLSWWMDECYQGKSHAGCGTVAMAQIMWYWKFPPQYEWDDMPNQISCDSHVYQADLIAHLYRDCGEANDMHYLSCRGSFTTTNKLETGMKKFRYPNANKRRRGDHDDGQWWPNLIRANLDAGRPMIYRGDKCDFCGEKHFWNITGYGSEDLFYCNWGWRGSYNGWYRLDTFLPDSVGNYRKNNMIIRDIYPDWNVQDDGTYENITKGQDEELRAFNRNITLKNVTLTDNARAKLCFTQTLTIEGELTIGPGTSFILQSCAEEAVAAQAMQTDAYHGENPDNLEYGQEETDMAEASVWETLPPEIESETDPTILNNVWSLYPNPNQGSFEVRIAAPHVVRHPKTLSVYSPDGHLVYETDFEGDRCSVHGINTKGLHLALLKTPEQTYVLKVLIR